MGVGWREKGTIPALWVRHGPPARASWLQEHLGPENSKKCQNQKEKLRVPNPSLSVILPLGLVFLHLNRPSKHYTHVIHLDRRGNGDTETILRFKKTKWIVRKMKDLWGCGHVHFGEGSWRRRRIKTTGGVVNMWERVESQEESGELLVGRYRGVRMCIFCF